MPKTPLYKAFQAIILISFLQGGGGGELRHFPPLTAIN